MAAIIGDRAHRQQCRLPTTDFNQTPGLKSRMTLYKYSAYAGLEHAVLVKKFTAFLLIYGKRHQLVIELEFLERLGASVTFQSMPDSSRSSSRGFCK